MRKSTFGNLGILTTLSALVHEHKDDEHLYCADCEYHEECMVEDGVYLRRADCRYCAECKDVEDLRLFCASCEYYKECKGGGE